MKQKTKLIFDKCLKCVMYLPVWNNLMKLALYRYVIYGDRSRFVLAKTATVQNAIINVISGNIVIEDDVFFGQNVCLLTGTHDYTKFGNERMISVVGKGRDITIKKGAWLATNVTVLGPCVIGENSVVAASSLVKNDVPPNTLVAGVPARVIKKLNS